MTCSPGLKWRWYVLPRITSAPSARTSSGWSDLTVPFVPTGMNAGVRISPWAVARTPARAAPSVASTRNVTGPASRRRTSRSDSAPRSPRDRSLAPPRLPTNAITSARSVERGRWKFVSSASTLRNSKPGAMKSVVRPGELARSRTIVSSTRTVVVPTASTRCACVDPLPRRRCDGVPLAVELRAPRDGLRSRDETCRARRAGSPDSGIERGEELRREVKPRGRCGGRALHGPVHRLVALWIRERLVDVRRQRHLAIRAIPRRPRASARHHAAPRRRTGPTCSPARRRLDGRTSASQVAVLVHALDEEHLDRPTRGAPEVQAAPARRACRSRRRARRRARPEAPRTVRCSIAPVARR